MGQADGELENIQPQAKAVAGIEAEQTHHTNSVHQDFFFFLFCFLRGSWCKVHMLQGEETISKQIHLGQMRSAALVE